MGNSSGCGQEWAEGMVRLEGEGSVPMNILGVRGHCAHRPVTYLELFRGHLHQLVDTLHVHVKVQVQQVLWRRHTEMLVGAPPVISGSGSESRAEPTSSEKDGPFSNGRLVTCTRVRQCRSLMAGECRLLTRGSTVAMFCTLSSRLL